MDQKTKQLISIIKDMDRASKITAAQSTLALLIQLGQKKTELARMIGVTPSLINFWIGGGAAPKPDHLVKIIKVLVKRQAQTLTIWSRCTTAEPMFPDPWQVWAMNQSHGAIESLLGDYGTQLKRSEKCSKAEFMAGLMDQMRENQGLV